ncbi:hypothetical protein ABZ215_24640 [Amycolatopsis sp. NPDC006131]|uniref:hypothetical protein n=1 Tax=Amycolatopsis sp. NPDC006131 TaxID=3156731 RepID=UPI0033B0CA43
MSLTGPPMEVVKGLVWTKLGDEYPDATRDLSDAAWRTHTEALCWSNRRLLDLVIPKRDLKRFAETEDPQLAAKELEETGWWQDLGDSWFIGVRFSEWQLERSVVEHRRDLNADRQRRHRLHKSGDHSMCTTDRCNALRDASRDALPGTGRVGTGREPKDATEGKEAHATVSNIDGRLCDRCGGSPTRVDGAGSRLCSSCGPHVWRAA